VWWGWRDRGLDPQTRALWRGPVAWVTAANLVVSMAIPGVDATAHTQGTIAGAVVAALGTPRGPARWGRLLFGMAAGLALAGIAGWLGSPFALSSVPSPR